MTTIFISIVYAICGLILVTVVHRFVESMVDDIGDDDPLEVGMKVLTFISLWPLFLLMSLIYLMLKYLGMFFIKFNGNKRNGSNY